MNTPNIRFKGFTDPWEKRKCKEILNPVKNAMKIGPFGSALKKEFYTETGVKVYAQENVFKEDFSIGDYYISEERYETLKGCKLEPRDLVISMMGTIGACAIFPDNAEPGIMNSHLLRLKLRNDIHPELIHQLLRDSDVIRKQIDRLSVGSIMSGLSSSVVQKLFFPIPKFDEQKKIASLLLQFDNLITLHQRKCDDLKEVKKYMLQKMFPKKGEKVPEIRFKGFTGDWKVRKFGELYERRMERNNGQFDNTKWISVAKMYYQDPDKVTSNNIDTRTYVMRKGDIAFEGHTNNEFKLGRFVVNDIGDGVISELFPIYKPIQEGDVCFWKYYIQIEAIMLPKLLKCIEISYTSSNKLDGKTFLKESILVPSKEEQEKIGAYFTNLDNQITLYQKKLDTLKEVKKFMLQNMFPQ